MEAGDTLESRFELNELLGEGGMGEVYLAWDRELQRRVAIKLLLPQLRTDPRAMDEMKREVSVNQRLRHTGIVRLHDFRVHERTPYIVMEYVEGEPLAHHQYRQPGHRFSESQFLTTFAFPILDAVAHAHCLGVVHRDLKPSNLMVLPGGRLKLLDFGIAATLKTTYTRVTGKGRGLTPNYASPEQINGEDPSPSMDIYALGCVFYEMLTGRPPFHQGDILHQQLTCTPPRLERVSSSTADAIDRCLAKSPADRWGSVPELTAGLLGGVLADPWPEYGESRRIPRSVRNPVSATVRKTRKVSAPVQKIDQGEDLAIYINAVSVACVMGGLLFVFAVPTWGWLGLPLAIAALFCQHDSRGRALVAKVMRACGLPLRSKDHTHPVESSVARSATAAPRNESPTEFGNPPPEAFWYVFLGVLLLCVLVALMLTPA